MSAIKHSPLLRTPSGNCRRRLPYQRSEKPIYRNGYKLLSFPSPFGRLQLFRLDSRNAVPFSSLLHSLRKGTKHLLAFLAIRFWMKGASTRAVSRELNRAFGVNLSPATVSTLTNALEPVIEAWQKKPIAPDISYLFLDATYLPFKRPQKTHKNALFLALGVTSEGTRHFLGYFVGDRESTDSWEAFLDELLDRGLRRDHLRLVVSDHHKGIEGAVQSRLGLPQQLCLVHLLRNLRARVSRTNWKLFLEDFKAIFWARSKEEALVAKGRFVERWEKWYSKAVGMVVERFDGYVQFMNEPKPLWRYLRSTNLIERFIREVKRRTRSAGAMHSELEVGKLLYSVTQDQEASWRNRRLWKAVKGQEKTLEVVFQ